MTVLSELIDRKLGMEGRQLAPLKGDDPATRSKRSPIEARIGILEGLRTYAEVWEPDFGQFELTLRALKDGNWQEADAQAVLTSTRGTSLHPSLVTSVCAELLSELGYLKHVRPPSPPNEDEQRRRDFASLLAALRLQSVPLSDVTFGERWSGLQATVNMLSQVGLVVIEGNPGQEAITLTRAGKELLSDQD